MIPAVDAQTSQMNIADLMASQSSPEELNAAYARVETRCAQSISRSPSPCPSQYSNYTSQCPSPISPTFSPGPFASPAITYQDHSKDFGLGTYGNGFASPVECNTPAMTGGWVWGNQVKPQTYDPYQPNIGRSASCRW